MHQLDQERLGSGVYNDWNESQIIHGNNVHLDIDPNEESMNQNLKKYSETGDPQYLSRPSQQNISVVIPLEENPYSTPLVRESKRTKFEEKQFALGQLMDERFGAPPGEKSWTDLFLNHGPTILLIAIIVIANFVVMAERFFYYTLGDGKKYKDAVGYGIPIARSSAAGIKLNSAFILLTVLRNLLSYLRTTFLGEYLPFDKNITLHKWLANTIAIMATIHVCAHFVNFYTIGFVADPVVLQQIGLLKPGAVPKTPTQSVFETLPGLTGLVITAVMTLMYITAFSSVRRPMFEVFWFTHHLFIIYYVFNFFHGAAGILEAPTFWAWTIIPVVLYIIERCVRVYRGSKKNILLQVSYFYLFLK